jgi:hypothetical protein
VSRILTSACMLALLATPPSHSASLSDISAGLAACAGEADDAVRLACYDRLAKGVPTAASGKAVQETKPDAAQPAGANDRFGVAGSEVARKRRAEEEKNKPASEKVDRLNARVTAIDRRARGELVVTLDNGQVWLQKEAQYLPLETGDEVTVLAGALGSYRLIVAGRATAVTRIQ